MRYGERFDLGLAIAEVHAKPGVGMTLNEIASFCGVEHNSIQVMESSIFRKLRRRRVLWQLREEFTCQQTKTF